MINSLYVHIPFCVRKCLYCDFNSCSNREMEDKYVDCLISEINNIEQKQFKTIFVGGGTPTILSMSNTEKLLSSLSAFQAKEFTFEANPGTLDKKKLKMLKSYGVNRLSIGLQAYQDRLLKKLGRIHNFYDFFENFQNARECGFDNINIDLMFGIPDQTLSDWKETLKTVIDLNPEHLSCYGLIIEEGTPFYELYEAGKLAIPDEDTERDMYNYTVELLKKNNYKHYEISNFSKHGYECKHNITYWMDEQYIGVGAGAHSYCNNIRYSNCSNINNYINGIINESIAQDKTYLSLEDELSEFMFLGLRMIDGIDKNRFISRFGHSMNDIYGDELTDLINSKLLEDTGEFIKLTSRGIEVSNQVFVKFLKN